MAYTPAEGTATPFSRTRPTIALCAEATCDAVVEYERHFDEITRRARDRFLARDWRGSFEDSRERLLLYSLILNSLTHRTRELMGERLDHRSIWSAIKAAYSALIAKSDRWEIAESFFNSLTRRIFATEGVNQAIEFVDTDFDSSASEQHEIARTYSSRSLAESVTQLLTDERIGGFAPEYGNRFGGVLDIATRSGAELAGHGDVNFRGATLSRAAPRIACVLL